MFSVHFYNDIPRLHTCLFRCKALADLCDLRDIISIAGKKDKRKDKCHDKVKHRSGGNHTDPCPDRLFAKCPVICTLAVFSLHHTGTSKRKQF